MIPTIAEEHYCDNPSLFPFDKFHQLGVGRGKYILIVGESPAANGWRKSGRAFYDTKGHLLATGKRLNRLLSTVNLSLEECGFTELAKCFVGKNRKILEKCSEKCWPIFTKQLGSINYELIIILGVKTLEIFNKLAETELKTGSLHEVKINHNKYMVLPIYHPSPVNPYSERKNQLILKSIRRALLKIISQHC